MRLFQPDRTRRRHHAAAVPDQQLLALQQRHARLDVGHGHRPAPFERGPDHVEPVERCFPLTQVARRGSDRLRRGVRAGLKPSQPLGHEWIAIYWRQAHSRRQHQPALADASHSGHRTRPYRHAPFRPPLRCLNQPLRVQTLACRPRLPLFRALFRIAGWGLGLPRRQRGQFALARRALTTVRVEVRPDLGRAGRERLHDSPGHAGDLERAVATVRIELRRIAERLHPRPQLGVEHRAHDVLAGVQLVRFQCVPLAIGRPRRIRDYGVDVKLRLAVPVDVVKEGGGNQVTGADRLLRTPVPGPRLGKVPLHPAERRR